MSRLTFDVPRDMHRRLKVLAANSGKTMREMILEWIKQHLDRQDGKRKGE